MEIAGVKGTRKGHLKLNRSKEAGPVRTPKVSPDTERPPGSVTATLHSVDRRKDVAGFGQIEIDWAW